MDTDYAPPPALQAMCASARQFGLTDQEVWRTLDHSLVAVGPNATVSEYLDELSGALAGAVLSSGRNSATRER